MHSASEIINNYPMSDTETLLRCFKNNNYNLSIKKINKKNVLKPSFHWYATSIEDNNGQTQTGTGEHFSPEIAKIKSISESIERYFLSNVDIKNWSIYNLLPVTSNNSDEIKNSNGIAFHTKVELAIENAMFELVERHSVLSAWLAKSKVLKLNITFNKYNLLSQIYSFKNNVSYRYLLVPNEYNIPVVACVIQGKGNKPHSLIGYGCHYSVEKAIEKSFYEAWRFLFNYKCLSESTAQTNQFVDHYFHYVDNYISLNEIFNVTKSFKVRDLPLCSHPNNLDKSLNLIKCNKISVLDASDYGLVGYVVKVESNQLIDLWSGPLTKDLKERKKGEWHPIA